MLCKQHWSSRLLRTRSGSDALCVDEATHACYNNALYPGE